MEFTPVAGQDAPSRGLGHADGLDGLCDGPNLVDLEKQRVDHLAVDGLLDALGVGHEHVVPDDLADAGGGQLLRRLPVVLCTGKDRSYSLARQDIKLQTENKGTPAQRDPQ